MKNRKTKLFIIILLVLIAIFIICAYISCNTLTISSYVVSSSKLPKEFDGYKILQISDLHNKYYGKDGYKLIEKIDNLNPNIVVMTGDMVSSKDTDYEAFFNIAYNISKKYTTYYIFGNHEEDLSLKNKYRIINELKSYGVHVLFNTKEEIVIGDDKINIYGLSKSLWENKSNKKVKNDYLLPNLFKEINNDEFNLLLAHNPLYFEDYAKYNPDLILSGHVHGGIVRLPFIGGILSPERKLFPKYNKGEYKLENSKLIVNAGIGLGRLPIRLFNPLDISLIELKSISD